MGTENADNEPREVSVSDLFSATRLARLLDESDYGTIDAESIAKHAMIWLAQNGHYKALKSITDASLNLERRFIADNRN